jgi:hypothetical protein
LAKRKATRLKLQGRERQGAGGPAGGKRPKGSKQKKCEPEKGLSVNKRSRNINISFTDTLFTALKLHKLVFPSLIHHLLHSEMH